MLKRYKFQEEQHAKLKLLQHATCKQTCRFSTSILEEASGKMSDDKINYEINVPLVNPHDFQLAILNCTNLYPVLVQIIFDYFVQTEVNLSINELLKDEFHLHNKWSELITHIPKEIQYNVYYCKVWSYDGGMYGGLGDREGLELILQHQDAYFAISIEAAYLFGWSYNFTCNSCTSLFESYLKLVDVDS